LERAAFVLALIAILLAFTVMPLSDLALTLLLIAIIYPLMEKAECDNWAKALGLTFLSGLGAYYGFRFLAYGPFVIALLLFPELSAIMLPFAVLGLSGAVMVSPILNGYPASVKINYADAQSVIASALTVYDGGGLAAMGFLIPFGIAYVADVISPFTPTPAMIKLSEPLFVGIGIGILVNIVRVKVRLFGGIKRKIRKRV